MLNGETIRKKRKAMGLSAEKLADLLGVNKENIYKWEKGHMPSNPQDYLKLENWLKTGKLENIPRGTLENILKESNHSYSQPQNGGLPDLRDKHIELLERENVRLGKDYRANLDELSRDIKAIAGMQAAVGLAAEQLRFAFLKIGEVRRRHIKLIKIFIPSNI